MNIEQKLMWKKCSLKMLRSAALSPSGKEEEIGAVLLADLN